MQIEHSETDRYQALLALYRRYGRLTALDVLEAATDEASPLHGAFEWDDAVAAHAHRVQQAYQLIDSYKVKIHRDDRDEPIRVKAFVFELSTGAYASVEDVSRDPDRRRAKMERMRARYISMAQEADQFDEFAAVVEATRNTLARA